MTDGISEIGEKKNDDKWGQVSEYRERLAQRSEQQSGAEGAAAAAASAGTAQTGAVSAVEGSKDVAGISAEALGEAKKPDTSNSSLKSRVNLDAWNDSKPKDGSNAVAEGDSVGKSKESKGAKKITQDAGSAGAAGASTVAGAGGIEVNAAKGALDENKPQTVPGVGEGAASQKQNN